VSEETPRPPALELVARLLAGGTAVLSCLDYFMSPVKGLEFFTFILFLPLGLFGGICVILGVLPRIGTLALMAGRTLPALGGVGPLATLGGLWAFMGDARSLAIGRIAMGLIGAGMPAYMAAMVQGNGAKAWLGASALLSLAFAAGWRPAAVAALHAPVILIGYTMSHPSAPPISLHLRPSGDLTFYGAMLFIASGYLSREPNPARTEKGLWLLVAAALFRAFVY
jgi:hypothetical protein